MRNCTLGTTTSLTKTMSATSKPKCQNIVNRMLTFFVAAALSNANCSIKLLTMILAQCHAIANVNNLVFRKTFLKENSIPIIPP